MFPVNALIKDVEEVKVEVKVMDIVIVKEEEEVMSTLHSLEKETKLYNCGREERRATMKGTMKKMINLELNVILIISLAIILGTVKLRI